MILDIVYSHYSSRWLHASNGLRSKDSVHRHGHCKEKQETVYQEECINTAVCTAITLQSIHIFQSLLQEHCFIFSPTHPLPVYIYSPEYTSSGVTVRPSQSDEIGQPLLQLPPCALHAIRTVRMWRMKHSLIKRENSKLTDNMAHTQISAQPSHQSSVPPQEMKTSGDVAQKPVSTQNLSFSKPLSFHTIADSARSAHKRPRLCRGRRRPPKAGEKSENNMYSPSCSSGATPWKRNTPRRPRGQGSFVDGWL